MADYIALRAEADPCNEDITDLIAAYLAEIGYEMFESDNKGVTAYVPSCIFDAATARECLGSVPVDCTITLSHELIEGKDWNEEWEKNYFKPIVIDGECVVHSSFHKNVPPARYDIVIDPKMAFGTGHHSTTTLMVRKILAAEMAGKTVIDMGTGTGILAILAKMRGADKAIGIEIDHDAWLNSVDNSRLNSVETHMICSDSSTLVKLDKADIFIANINRNVITADLPAYARALNTDGVMWLSGFYLEDIPIVESAAKACGLKSDGVTSDNNWACLQLRHS